MHSASESYLTTTWIPKEERNWVFDKRRTRADGSYVETGALKAGNGDWTAVCFNPDNGDIKAQAGVTHHASDRHCVALAEAALPALAGQAAA